MVAGDGVRIDGRTDGRFDAVRSAFAANFRDLDEVGAGLCVICDGVPVVELWGGHTDARRTQPWRRDTLVNAYSVGKGVLSVLALAALERGEIRLDAPVARWWPEFSAGEKAETTVRELLAHQAGLPAVRERLPEGAMFDWESMCASLAAQSPYWRAGSAHGYHVNTYGYLVGELLRRATGLTVGDALARRVSGPAGAEFYFGVPPDRHGRVAEVLAPNAKLDSEEKWAAAFPPTGDEAHDRMIWHAYFNPSGLSGLGSVNTSSWRSSVIPSTSGHGTATAIAKIYAAFLSGGPPGAGWAGSELRREATSVQSDGLDRVLGRPSRFGLGFQLASPERPIGPGESTFGHYGYGGTVGFADPEAKLAVGYLMNRPGDRWRTPRTQRLLESIYACV